MSMMSVSVVTQRVSMLPSFQALPGASVHVSCQIRGLAEHHQHVVQLDRAHLVGEILAALRKGVVDCSAHSMSRPKDGEQARAQLLKTILQSFHPLLPSKLSGFPRKHVSIEDVCDVCCVAISPPRREWSSSAAHTFSRRSFPRNESQDHAHQFTSRRFPVVL